MLNSTERWRLPESRTGIQPLKQSLVLDAGPLIFIAKTSLRHLIPLIEVELFTSTAVAREVLNGEFPEKPTLEKLFTEAIQVEGANPLPPARGLHVGESTAITLASRKKAVFVSDDRVALIIASAHSVETAHTTHFIFRALSKHACSAEHAENLVKELVENGWWCDAQTLTRIHQRIHASIAPKESAKG